MEDTQKTSDGPSVPKIMHPILIYGVLCVAMVVVIGTMIYVYSVGNHVMAHYVPLVGLSTQIKEGLTQGHLLFEELLLEDDLKGMPTVWERYQFAEDAFNKLMTGGEGKYHHIHPLEDSKMKLKVQKFLDNMGQFRKITKKRLELRKTAVVEDEIDRQYHSLFWMLFKDVDDVEMHLNQSIRDEYKTFSQVQIALIVLGFLLFGWVGLTFRHYINRRRQFEGDLRDIEQQTVWLSKFPGENPNPILRIIKDGSVVYRNKAATPVLAAWGYDTDGVLPVKWHDMVTDSLKTRQNIRSEVDCDDRTFSLTFAPVVDADYVNVYGLDITDRKKAGQALRKSEEQYRLLNEQLEQRVSQRTVQLEAANKELESFAYSVSHDLRSPLRAIDGFSQALLEDFGDILNEQATGLLDRVRGASQRMGGLIDDLLALSRLTRREMHYEDVNLSELAREVSDHLAQQQPDRSVKMVIAPNLVVHGDDRLLHVMMENLIGNAWKFTSKQQTPEIEIGVEHQRGKPVYYVRDNGAGFDMKYADKMFGAFQRLHTSTEFPGTGIGLATVQRIIHRHGGEVWAEGTEDRGAVFYFTLNG